MDLLRDFPDLHVMRVPASGGAGELVPGSGNSGCDHCGCWIRSDGGREDDGVLRYEAKRRGLQGFYRVSRFGDGEEPIDGPGPRIAGVPGYAPGEKSVVYKILDNGNDNLWEQPIDGGPGKKLRILGLTIILLSSLSFRRMGKSLGVTTGQRESNVVLFRDEGEK